jgi:hypothetical protein
MAIGGPFDGHPVPSALAMARTGALRARTTPEMIEAIVRTAVRLEGS